MSCVEESLVAAQPVISSAQRTREKRRVFFIRKGKKYPQSISFFLPHVKFCRLPL
jgi:hypothetical protein